MAMSMHCISSNLVRSKLLLLRGTVEKSNQGNLSIYCDFLAVDVSVFLFDDQLWCLYKCSVLCRSPNIGTVRQLFHVVPSWLTK